MVSDQELPSKRALFRSRQVDAGPRRVRNGHWVGHGNTTSVNFPASDSVNLLNKWTGEWVHVNRRASRIVIESIRNGSEIAVTVYEIVEIVTRQIVNVHRRI